MITHSAAAVFAPGGTGTSWEIFQLLEMIKSHQLRPIPVYFLGKQEEWSPLTNMISEMVAHGTIKNTITPIFIDCSQDLVNHLAYDLKLTTTPPSDPSTACKTPTPYETKARLEQGIM